MIALQKRVAVSQLHNNEMGILLRREDDAELYKDIYEKAQRIKMERVSTAYEAPTASDITPQKISTSKITQKYGMKTADWLAKAAAVQLLTAEDDRYHLTPAAK